ncbi:MAG: DUF1585 domain-containing protein [Deltaproteobacteria bacterium]|nr:DUF1585 domain-containing protein [Deltaproteobacteria bacterium]
MNRSNAAVCLILAISLGPELAHAQVCEPNQTQDALQYLRRLSLDLRGRLPSIDELGSVVTNDQVDPGMIDAMLASAEFLEQARRYHTALLWLNLDQVLANNVAILADTAEGRGARDGIYWVRAAIRSTAYRGGQVKCLDEPARFDSVTGAILTTVDPVDPNLHREGWVLVRPYWAPDTEIKVCAFDAQANATALDDRGNSVDCRLSRERGCGCGPNLDWCHSGFAPNTTTIINQAMVEQTHRFIERVIAEDRPYTEVVTGTDVEINGPLVHYFRNLALQGGNNLFATPETNYTLPELSFADESWVASELGTRHSGILTLPAYLTKFQSNRGRANRFYNAFLCTHFAPPAGGLPSADDECHQEPDLTKRCGCQYCHIRLEPAASHWGRWSEAGVAPLNETEFPELRETCVVPSGRRPGQVCRRFYLTEALYPSEQPFLGKLLPYVFADEDRKQRIQEGPRKWASEAVESGAFASCAVRNLWTSFMGREAEVIDEEVVGALATEFSTGGYRFRALVKALVTRPEYVEGSRFGEDVP